MKFINKKWKYPLIIGSSLLLIGALLQFVLGSIVLHSLAWPINVILLLLFLGILLGLTHLKLAIELLRKIVNPYAAVVSISLTLLLCCIVGLGKLGWLFSWPWLLQILWMVIILWVTLLRRIRHFKIYDIPFFCNHLGLFLIIISLGLGAADKKELFMTAHLSNKEWRAEDAIHHIKPLLITIELNKFSLSSYPPKLVMIDTSTDKDFSSKKTVECSVQEAESVVLNGWRIKVIKYLENAFSKTINDSIEYVPSDKFGATFATFICAENIDTHQRKEGWVSCGNFLHTPLMLKLTENLTLMMAKPVAKLYQSDVTVWGKNKKAQVACIEVNKPYYIDGWNIYQYGYDKEEGRWSTTSIFQLVYDPWLWVVYLGMFLLAVGCMCQLFIKKERKL